MTSSLAYSPRFRSPRVGLAAVVLLAACGCDFGGSELPPPPPIDTSPQAQYDRVIEVIEDLLGEDQQTLRSDSGSGTSATHYEIDAPETVTIPENPTQQPRLTIVITQVSSYSYLPKRSDEEPEPEPSGRSSRGNSSSAEMKAQLEDMGVEVLDPAKLEQDVENATRRRLQTPSLVGQSYDAVNSSTYDLIYDRGRWRYAKPPAADAMSAATAVVERALERQM